MNTLGKQNFTDLDVRSCQPTSQYANYFKQNGKCGATDQNGNWDTTIYESWPEWRDPRAVGMATILLEHGFHDTQCDVLWISKDSTRKLIAKAIVDALDANP